MGVLTGDRNWGQLSIQQEKWEFIAKEQVVGVSGWKITKKHQGKGGIFVTSTRQNSY